MVVSCLGLDLYVGFFRNWLWTSLFLDVIWIAYVLFGLRYCVFGVVLVLLFMFCLFVCLQWLVAWLVYFLIVWLFDCCAFEFLL